MQERITYYYENGEPYRYMIIDSPNLINTDYLYFYDSLGVHTHAKYTEDIDDGYEIELISYDNEKNTKITEWIDS